MEVTLRESANIHIHTVGQVLCYTRELLDFDEILSDIWISGELSNLFKSHAEHYYFTIKDSDGQLKCVLFKRDTLDITLENGMAVVAHGNISLYEQRGDLQYYVDFIQPEGLGMLHMQFQLLKAKLEAEGLFDISRKRSIPLFPKRIGVVTSPTGAVLHDIVNIISRRYPLAELILAPTLVQGDGAIDGISKAIGYINSRSDIDVIILARGGGSLEDLWAFNEEAVARAIYASKIPIISGIGHDTDFTIADYVADLRAPTPSAAEELAVPDIAELKDRIGTYSSAIVASIINQIDRNREKLQFIINSIKLPDLSRYRQNIDDMIYAVFIHTKNAINLKQSAVNHFIAQLQALSPLRTLDRGYALIQSKINSHLVDSIHKVNSGDSIEIQVSDGKFSGRVTGKKGYGKQGALI